MTIGRGMFRVWIALSALWATAVLADFVFNLSTGFYTPTYFQFGIMFPSEQMRLAAWILLLPIKIVALPLLVLSLGLGVAWVIDGFSNAESSSPVPKGFWRRATGTLSVAGLCALVAVALIINSSS